MMFTAKQYIHSPYEINEVICQMIIQKSVSPDMYNKFNHYIPEKELKIIAKPLKVTLNVHEWNTFQITYYPEENMEVMSFIPLSCYALGPHIGEGFIKFNMKEPPELIKNVFNIWIPVNILINEYTLREFGRSLSYLKLELSENPFKYDSCPYCNMLAMPVKLFKKGDIYYTQCVNCHEFHYEYEEEKS